MRNSILFIILALFASLNITGCSLFSSDEDEQETATFAEEGVPVGNGDFSDDEFASDDFESGGVAAAATEPAASEDSFASGSDDFGSDDFGDDLEFDAAAMAKDEGGGELESLASEDVEVEDNFGDDYPDDDYAQLGEGTQAAASDSFIDDSFGANETAFVDAQPVDDSLFVDQGGVPDDALSSNEDLDLFGQTQEMEPVVDTPTYADSSFGDSSYDSMGSEPEEKNYVSVKKMKPAAYSRASSNINRLYVVRPGDNMDTIAQKIYGDSSRSEDLYTYNSHFRGKTIKVGDKIYYESPNNPNDQQMKTYYEDSGIAPQYYTSDEGDNIRKVAQSLLGHERSWMEVWATNENVESKWRLPAGIRLRYWPDGAGVPAMAMNEPVNNSPAMEPPPAPMPEASEPMEELPSGDLAMNDDSGMNNSDQMAELDDPQAFDDSPPEEDFNPPPVAGSTGAPPPPPQAVAPPPPPPPAPKADFNKPFPPTKRANINPAGDDPLAAFGDDSTIMAGIGALLILAAIIVLVFIRRNRAKRVNFSQTQV